MYSKKYPHKNTYRVKGSTATLTITKRDGSKEQYIFDADKLDSVRRYVWRSNIHNALAGNRIAVSGAKSEIKLHRLLNSTPRGEECSFVDHDTHNCRCSNLRNGTHYDTMIHAKPRTVPQSGYANIHWSNSARKWAVMFKRQKRTIYLGSYASLIEALKVRNQYLSEEKRIVGR